LSGVQLLELGGEDVAPLGLLTEPGAEWLDGAVTIGDRIDQPRHAARDCDQLVLDQRPPFARDGLTGREVCRRRSHCLRDRRRLQPLGHRRDDGLVQRLDEDSETVAARSAAPVMVEGAAVERASAPAPAWGHDREGGATSTAFQQPAEKVCRFGVAAPWPPEQPPGGAAHIRRSAGRHARLHALPGLPLNDDAGRIEPRRNAAKSEPLVVEPEYPSHRVRLHWLDHIVRVAVAMPLTRVAVDRPRGRAGLKASPHRVACPCARASSLERCQQEIEHGGHLAGLIGEGNAPAIHVRMNLNASLLELQDRGRGSHAVTADAAQLRDDQLRKRWPWLQRRRQSIPPVAMFPFGAGYGVVTEDRAHRPALLGGVALGALDLPLA
jgi:hypothetical protein